MLGDEALQIGEATASKMRLGNAEMVQKFGEAGLYWRALGRVGKSCYGRSPLVAWIGSKMRRAAIRDRR
jgi:hypothetical protein